MGGIVVVGCAALWLLPSAESPKPAEVGAQPAAKPLAQPLEKVSLSSKLFRPASTNIVAIGDLHGDLRAARKALLLAKVIDNADRWVGGTTVVVQTGDEIDRGDEDKEVLELFEKLKGDAKSAGGELIALNGNHELMNVAQDFRYVSKHSFEEFADKDPGKAASEGLQSGRAQAFKPGGKYAGMLSERPVMMQVGDTVFVHGGILPKHVRYGLDRINDEVDAWMLARLPSPPTAAMGEDGLLWTRLYSDKTDASGCAALHETLQAFGAKRMVVGHTVQQAGINAACDDKVWRIDTGMSRAYGGNIEVLLINGDKVSRLVRP